MSSGDLVRIGIVSLPDKLYYFVTTFDRKRRRGGSKKQEATERKSSWKNSSSMTYAFVKFHVRNE